MSRPLESYRNNCTLVAVKAMLAGTRTDQEIKAAFLSHGYRPGKGMRTRDWTAAARDLGLALNPIRIKETQPKRYTLADFVKAYPKGSFFVTTNGHAFCVFDGEVWDPNCAGSTLGRGIYCIHQVLNAPPRVAPTKIAWLKLGSGTTGVDQRRLEVYDYIARHGPTEPAEIFLNTSYHKGDFKFDRERGRIRFS